MIPKLILIVEDEGLIALHLMEILTNAGYKVLEPVASGEEAIRHLEEKPLPGPHPDGYYPRWQSGWDRDYPTNPETVCDSGHFPHCPFK